MRLNKLLLIFAAQFGYLFSSVAQTKACDFLMKCEDTLDYDTCRLAERSFRYKIISIHSYKNENSSSCTAEIILPDLNSESDKALVTDLLQQLGDKNKLDEFVAFRSCDARYIYVSSFPPGSPERKILQTEYIGSFKVRN